MSLANVTHAARVYARAEMLTARIRLEASARRIIAVAVAVFLALIGLVFVNIALYAAMLAAWGPVWTPLSLALLDFALAGVAVGFAALSGPGRELVLAEEMKTVAGEALEEQVQAVIPGAGLMGMAGDSASLRLLVPLVTTIAGLLRRKAPKEN